MYQLAVMLKNGFGVDKKDLVMAYNLANSSKRKGNSRASKLLESIKKEMTPDQLNIIGLK